MTDFSSSDLIDFEHPEKGQTNFSNTYGCESSIVVNLRYINGRTNRQEVEIITAKDETTTIPKKYAPGISADILNLGSIYNIGTNADADTNGSFYLRVKCTKGFSNVSSLIDEYKKPSNIPHSSKGEPPENAEYEYVWIPIENVARYGSINGPNEEGNCASGNTLDSKKILSYKPKKYESAPPLTQQIIEDYIKEQYSTLLLFDQKIVLTYFDAFNTIVHTDNNNTESVNIGRHYAWIYLIYRNQKGELILDNIYTFDKGFSHFNGSEIQYITYKYAANLNTEKYNTIKEKNAYCGLNFSVNNAKEIFFEAWAETLNATITGLKYNKNKKIYIEDLSFNVVVGETTTYSISYKIDNDKAIQTECSCCPLLSNEKITSDGGTAIYYTTQFLIMA